MWTNLHLYFPHLLSHLGEIWYRHLNIILNICKFHGKWQREGHTLLMNVNWNNISICNNIFFGPSPHTYHPTKIPHLALTRWRFMAVMIIPSIHRLMLLHVPKISLFSFPYLRNKQSENIARQDREFWTDLVKWHFQEMKCMIKSCRLHGNKGNEQHLCENDIYGNNGQRLHCIIICWWLTWRIAFQNDYYFLILC